MASEIELKYSLPSGVAPTVFSAPCISLFSVGDLTRFDMRSCYLSDDKRLLKKNRASLRVRKENNDLVATFKTTSSEKDGLSERGEWNAICTGVFDAVSALLAVGAPEWIADLGGLKEECSVDFIRLQQDVKYNDCRFHVAADEGFFIHEGRRAPFCELEIELAAGDKQNLIEYGRIVADSLGLSPEATGKYTRALEV